jgi:hypothetical protein
MGDTGVLVATRLARSCDVVGISTRPALVSGQELGNRLTNPERWRRNYLVPYRRFRQLDRVRTVHGRIVGRPRGRNRAGRGPRRRRGGALRRPGDRHRASNGFWRHDRVEDLATIEADLDAVSARLDEAATIAIVGAGPPG